MWYNEKNNAGACGMLSAKVRSWAKLNLSLNISGVSQGYHLLDSAVCSVNICDTVCARTRRDSLVNVYMHGRGSESIPPAQNNAVRAGEAFVAAFGTKGADIEIYKDIPIGAGLGGSSADAAGVLNALARLYKIADAAALKTVADSLGSDTGYMLQGGFARLTGRGERVEPFSCPRRLHMLLFLPRSAVSTPECYRKYDESPDPLRADTARLCAALCRGDLEGAAQSVYNALEAPACALNPEVAAALAAARSLSPSACAVTGSGSAVFALFESEELCRWAKAKYRGRIAARVVHTVEPGRAGALLRRSLYRLDGEEGK